MMSKSAITSKLEFKKAVLEETRAAYLALLSGRVKSYTIGSRSLTRFDLSELENTMTKTENEIATLEGMLRGGKARKAVGVVPRDW